MRSVAPALRIKRYVQSHTLTSPVNEALRRGRGGPEPYDGVAELWWDSLEDLAERTFIDLARSPVWLSEEHAIVMA